MKRYTYLLCILIATSANSALAAGDSLNLRLSLGSSWQARNDIQIPNTDLGTRFSLGDEAGPGPIGAARVELTWAIKERHGMRLLLAPLSYTKDVLLSETVQFSGQTFNPNETVEATYKFNSWRLGYYYSLVQHYNYDFRIGGTLKVRDAEIKLVQNDTISIEDNVGFVPLFYLAGSRRLSDRLIVQFDVDALGSNRGRAIDMGVALEWALSNRWQIGAEFRVLDGGAGNDRVYNFAQFNSAAVVLQTGF